MGTVMEYKCPCCGGEIEFNSDIQKMSCSYCGSEFDVETLKAYDEDLKNQKPDDMQWNTQKDPWSGAETENLSNYVCNSCGAEIIGEGTTGTVDCPYCGNHVILKGKFAGDLRPDLIIPFKLNKQMAIDGLNNHLKGKHFLPKVFKSQNHIEEIKGIYVPFWLFDTDVDASIRYLATKVRHWHDRNYYYTETAYFSVLREGNITFDNIPADGSSKMPDDLMESIEPYDLSEAVDFQTAYLSGYMADRYDVTAEQSITRTNERVKTSTEENFKKTVKGYVSVTTENSSIRTSNGKAKYALYPVWILNTTYKGEKYIFAMNGQTGKFVGNLPLDKGAYWRCFGILTGILSVVSYGIIFLMNLMGLL
ncbi:MAG: hypothetical protein UHK60_11685 [Acutalibacteraceae bacterium]|nr:hypothetical protein [Acutalibacteraceae bacterium]